MSSISSIELANSSSPIASRSLTSLQSRLLTVVGTITYLESLVKRVCVAAALLWLIYRTYCVIRKPVKGLVKHLGFDIPHSPLIELLEVRTDTVLLAWKTCDEKRAANAFEVHVNGKSQARLKSADDTIRISNLKSDCNYIIRIVAVNGLDLRAVSDALRIHTPPSPTDLDTANSSFTNAAATQQDTDKIVVKVVKVVKSSADPPTTALSSPTSAKDVNSHALQRKGGSLRHRSSARELVQFVKDEEKSLIIATENQQQLTVALENINREIVDLEQQLTDENLEAEKTRIELSSERDKLRTELRDKEAQSRSYRKQVNVLEIEARAAQARQQESERLLRESKAKLQKERDERAQWDEQILEAKTFVESCKSREEELRKGYMEERQRVQRSIDEESQTVRNLEEDIRVISTNIKKLEGQKQVNDSQDEETISPIVDEEMEAASILEHQSVMAALDMEYQAAMAELEYVNRECQNMQTRLQAMSDYKLRLTQVTGSNAIFISPAHSRSRQLSAENPILSPNPIASGQISTLNSPPNTAIFNPSMPTAFHRNFTSPVELNANEDIDVNRSNYFSSRRHNNTLENNSNDITMRPLESPRRHHSGRSMQDKSPEPLLPGLGAFAGSAMLPGLGASILQSSSEFGGQDPASPGSAGSQSPSLFASPQPSTMNLAFYSPDAFIDNDGRSVHSRRSLRPSSGTGAQSSKFAQILGFDKLNRQRGKTLTDDKLGLGQVHSQSMPKDIALADAFDGSAARRNSSHSNTFVESSRGGFGESNLELLSTLDSPRRVALLARKNGSSWGESIGRPSSSHSFNTAKSAETSKDWTWPANVNHALGTGVVRDAFHQRASTLGQADDWTARFPPRHQSGSINNFGNDTYLAELDGDSFITPIRSRVQAPIGTRPERPLTPKLNPAAKDFKSLFDFEEMERKSKANKGNSKRKSTVQDIIPADDSQLTLVEVQTPIVHVNDVDPPTNRMSRDSRSILTSESSTNELSSRGSIERSISNGLSDMQTSSPTLTGSAGKSSFMRKLGRKSSGGKFSLPVFGRDKRRLTDKTGDDHDAINTSQTLGLDTSMNSLESNEEFRKSERTPLSGRTWSSVFSTKIGKNKNKIEEDESDDEPSWMK